MNSNSALICLADEVGSMSRSMLLVFLLLLLIFTSQFEWRQQFVSDVDSSAGDPHKQQSQVSKREVVKEKIILSQEKHIQRLNELLTSLKEQLQQCRTNSTNETLNESLNALTENVIELEEQQILEDLNRKF